MSLSRKVKRRLIIASSGLVAVVVLALGGTWLYINVFSGDAPDPFSLDADEPAAGEDASNNDIDLEGTWSIAPESEAGYRVDEVLNGMDNTVVGRTSDVSGEVVVTDEQATAAEVTVDMTTITTDSDSRDSQFQGPIMNTDEYPTATFRLTEPVALADPLSADEPVSLTAQGELTIRDVTREVEAELQAQLSGDTVDVAGSIPITFTDFDLEPPNLAFVRVEDEGVVEFLLTLTKSQ